ncbi:hypothetical protein LOK49_LG02G02380 [Camellia lanceoleosa]|uniref:Uncharacterized protein n=1 Tax=Camellia lanceoleosa TaxID=1840588 RepID=A0ACC0IMR3_9ERIC|nr:hypothetical protein LOK49_LG02G02380 [Camellia lanceoleosa]
MLVFWYSWESVLVVYCFDFFFVPRGCFLFNLVVCWQMIGLPSRCQPSWDREVLL